MSDKQKQAQAALDEIENVIAEILNIAYKNGVTELSRFKFKEQCLLIREALEAMAAETNPKLQTFHDAKELPKKFIALYDDGSGGEVFYQNLKGKYNTAINDYDDYGVDAGYFEDAGFYLFIPLADNFKLGGEEDE